MSMTLVVDDTDAEAILLGILDQFQSPVLGFDFLPENRHSSNVTPAGPAVASAKVKGNIVKHDQPRGLTSGLDWVKSAF